VTESPVEGPCAERSTVRPSDDLRLVQRALARDEEALQLLTLRLECVPRFVRRFERCGARRIPRADFDDITQDVATAFWRCLARFDGSCRLETWLFGITRRIVLRWRTRRADFVPLDDDGAADAPALRTEVRDTCAIDAGRVLARLERRLRVVVLLKHVRDLSFDEIGARLGLSPNTVKTRYYRALEFLRSEIERREAEDARPRPAARDASRAAARPVARPAARPVARTAARQAVRRSA
jgi:RNA polymerase sigma-70 factor (ECF subfamily)